MRCEALIFALALLGPALVSASEHDRLLRVGVLASYYPFAFGDLGAATGFDVELARAACDTAGLDCEIVPIAAVADRIPALQNGTVDVLAAALVVTPERQEQVLFVHPYYYTSGTALAALEEQLGSLPEGWDSLRGKNVCTVEGHYLNDFVAETYGAKLVLTATEAAAVDALVRGECIAAFTDSASLVFRQVAAEQYGRQVAFVPSAEVLDVRPYGLAMAQNASALAISLSGALAQGLMSAGNSSQLLQLEDEFVVGAGGTQAPYLRGLVDAISYLVPPP